LSQSFDALRVGVRVVKTLASRGVTSLFEVPSLVLREQRSWDGSVTRLGYGAAFTLGAEGHHPTSTRRSGEPRVRLGRRV
jgi:hypothetical protein